jgi:hypothetical protein
MKKYIAKRHFSKSFPVSSQNPNSKLLEHIELRRLDESAILNQREAATWCGPSISTQYVSALEKSGALKVIRFDGRRNPKYRIADLMVALESLAQSSINEPTFASPISSQKPFKSKLLRNLNLANNQSKSSHV